MGGDAKQSTTLFQEKINGRQLDCMEKNIFF
jgi:hypothetical protein